MKPVDFSIIIPTYNRCDTLSNAIDSVIQQKSDNWELIIVDDGSNDRTEEVVSKYQDVKKFRYYFQKNKGVSAARNKGVKHSIGNYLIFLDSDDQLCPYLIQTLEKEEFSKYDFICWQVFRRIDNKEFIWKPKKLEQIYGGITATFLAGSCCYKKEIFITAGGFDPEMSFGENYELGLRISDIPNLRIKVIKTPLLKYYINTSKRPSNSMNNRLYSIIYQYKKHRQKYLEHPKENSRINYLLGYILENSGKNSVAVKFYRKAFRLNPMNLKAMVKSFFPKLN